MHVDMVICWTVSDESYQLAKTYKHLSDKLSEFSKILVELEIGKKQAADAKDYDEAEKIKVRPLLFFFIFISIMLMNLQADINEIKDKAEDTLRKANLQVTRDGRVLAIDANDTEVKPFLFICPA